MKAEIIYKLLKPHLQNMEPQEKRMLSNMIVGLKSKGIEERRRKIYSLNTAKKNLKLFQMQEMAREREVQ